MAALMAMLSLAVACGSDSERDEPVVAEIPEGYVKGSDECVPCTVLKLTISPGEKPLIGWYLFASSLGVYFYISDSADSETVTFDGVSLEHGDVVDVKIKYYTSFGSFSGYITGDAVMERCK